MSAELPRRLEGQESYPKDDGCCERHGKEENLGKAVISFATRRQPFRLPNMNSMRLRPSYRRLSPARRCIARQVPVYGRPRGCKQLL
jgi:hypothetical protein